MRYIKKMSVLRQVKQGFSEDGKTVSGLVKIEQYGKNLAVEVSVINFAPLSLGEYYCILADSNYKTELLPLRGKSIFNILSDLDMENGFCAIICFVKNDVSPIACAINGEIPYDWQKILAAAFPKRVHTPDKITKSSEIAHASERQEESVYNDEKLANENYFKEEYNGQELLQEAFDHAPIESAIKDESAQTRSNPPQDEDVENVRHSFTTKPSGYYLSVKSEIDKLLASYPKDDTLCGMFSCSEWVRIKGEENSPQYLVGIVYDEGKPLYICYALAATDKNSPPIEIKDVCTFVPATLFDESIGFFVIFQSTATGECIKPLQA